MLVRQAIDGHIAKGIHAYQTVQQHMGIKPIEGIVIELGVGGDTNIDRRDVKIAKILIPNAGGMSAPGGDYHADALGRSDAKGGTATERQLHQPMAGRRVVGLKLDHLVMIAGHLPDVQAGIVIHHGGPPTFLTLALRRHGLDLDHDVGRG